MDLSDEAWSRRLSELREEEIVSDENLLGSPFNGYADAERRAELVKNSMAGRDFQIVIYLRPQLSWLQSVYVQGVQQGSLRTPDEFLDGCLSSTWVRWSQLCDLLETTGAKSIIPRAYGGGRNVIADFMNVVGLERPTGKQAALLVNASISPAQAVILREFNRRNGSIDQARLRAAFQSRLMASTSGRWSVFREDRQHEILSAFESDWQDLTARVGITDVFEQAQFRNFQNEWRNQVAPYAGSDLSAPAVQDAMMSALDSLIREPQHIVEPKAFRFMREVLLRRSQ